MLRKSSNIGELLAARTDILNSLFESVMNDYVDSQEQVGFSNTQNVSFEFTLLKLKNSALN